MSRIPQPRGERGSLKWIQRAVNETWPALNAPILERLGADRRIEWRSPMATDDFAEYRDGEFLERLGLDHLREALAAFWPARGPQWDALGVTDHGEVLLVEAKAHVGEMCSPATAAGAASRVLIEARLAATSQRLGARRGHAPWTDNFYQLGNRLSHLEFLRDLKVPAFLLLVNFLNDAEMGGPTTPEAWGAAYQVALNVMGLRKRHALSPYVIEVFPDVGAVSALT